METWKGRSSLCRLLQSPLTPIRSTRYFTTTIPNSGIFLPVGRASKRASPSLSFDSYPPTPTTPSAGGSILGGHSDGPFSTSNAYTPPTPSAPKFSQSVGPGRAPSPQFKPKSRPSLPRPDSPLRKNQQLLATPGRPSLSGASSTANGAGNGRFASPTPGKFGASLGARRVPSSAGHSGDPGKRPGATPRPGGAASTSTTTGSALGKNTNVDDDGDSTPIGVARTADSNRRPASGFTPRARPTSNHLDEEVKRLRTQIEERDRQLKEQAASLAEMENSFSELQSLLPSSGSDGGKRSNRGSEDDSPQLRTLLREKNEKIASLTAEFDAHRADFRSTIDTLELASTETERVYERRVEELKEEVRELQEGSEDVDSVAQQLKQLTELVQDLEEGLEDARRGEAEARGEVEFLRGEVERGRSELRREREKAAAALKGAGAAVDVGSGPSGAKEVEQRDDEIRGLKAIIHSLSRDSVPDGTTPGSDNGGLGNRRVASLPRSNGSAQRTSLALSEERLARESLQREVKELQGLVERKSYREEQLEQELQRIQRASGSSGQRASARTLGSNGPSDKTVTPTQPSSGRDSKETAKSWRDGRGSSETPRRGPLKAPVEIRETTDTDGSDLWCEICETGGHDILTCTNMFGNQQASRKASVERHELIGPSTNARNGKDAVREGLRNLTVHAAHGEPGVAPLSPGRRPSPISAPPGIPMPNPSEMGPVAGKASGVVDKDKWCALCERDGHESVDCPFEDAF